MTGDKDLRIPVPLLWERLWVQSLSSDYLYKERLKRRLAGEPVDRAPNCNLIMAFAPLYIGKTQSQFYLDYKVLLESNLRVAKDFDLDILGAISDSFMAGWEIPHSTPHENLKAIAEALRDYPRY
ncbi:Hypothetical protein DEACI_2669 [Acididesulfobacillus acetoxydans]|uniref:Uroporphyrinogen decarboxylase (URO-D) n=1 Tax=Acididesulfobacillus acetoxydans TaxID=1561005 RepID=A0A8S0W3T8_9FIRM|nr:hypothetical protein [Acididesulfobacillus acetoxydans]CAA7601998.1 Hypothetical protein DEACI_2669 [Acididesulfobacillus acetoxydans]CEJ08159.1 Uroporphyrinogen decarboxylase (URO-D) [Acididesulfobacillus acetoxydans]